VGLRGRLRRLERNASEDLSSFVLEDGSRYYFDPTSGELFIFGVECVRIQGTGKSWPEIPETIKALAKARDRRAAFEQVPTGGLFPFDKDALIERGELVRRSLTYGRTLDDADPGGLSEP
jgi:hypothetical protein